MCIRDSQKEACTQLELELNVATLPPQYHLDNHASADHMRQKLQLKVNWHLTPQGPDVHHLLLGMHQVLFQPLLHQILQLKVNLLK